MDNSRNIAIWVEVRAQSIKIKPLESHEIRAASKDLVTIFFFSTKKMKGFPVVLNPLMNKSRGRPYAHKLTNQT